jgi:alpha-ketoglutarate-dependent taurine dioxygenase
VTRDPAPWLLRQGDLILWDNRCVFYRVIPHDPLHYRHFMQRTTVSGNPHEPSAR